MPNPRPRKFPAKLKNKFFGTGDNFHGSGRGFRRKYSKTSAWRLAREFDAWVLECGAKIHLDPITEWALFAYDIDTAFGRAYVRLFDSQYSPPWLHVRFEDHEAAAAALNGVDDFGDPKSDGPVNRHSGKYNYHPPHRSWEWLLKFIKEYLREAGFGKEKA